MENTKSLTIGLLKQLVDQLQSLTNEEFNAIMNGNVGLHLSLADPVPVRKRDPSSSENRQSEFEIAEQLKLFTTREEVLQCLKNADLKKSSLSRICKMVGGEPAKEDTVDRLHAKIVEVTVGYLLRSKAIRGINDDAKATAPPPQPLDPSEIANIDRHTVG